jgi:hypothetical protein
MFLGAYRDVPRQLTRRAIGVTHSAQFLILGKCPIISSQFTFQKSKQAIRDKEEEKRTEN